MLDGANSVGALQTFSTSAGPLVLNTIAPLTVSGPISAAGLTITTSGQLTLSGGVRVIGGAPALLQVSGGGGLVQTGVTTFRTGGALTINVGGGGTANFANLVTSGGLTLAGAGAAFTGAINAGGLVVDRQVGRVALTGLVNGVSGAAAAATVGVISAVNPNYTLNGCAIGSAACGGVIPAQASLLPTVSLQAGPPGVATTQPALDPAVIGGLSVNRLLPGAPPAQAVLPQLDLVVAPGATPQNQ